MSAADFLSKAGRALKSAQVLLDVGDTEGASNRVYYAMFDAAKAALRASDAPSATVEGKTHAGLIAAFSLYIIKSSKLSIDHGRALNRLHELRLIADYRGDFIDADTVRAALQDAAAFLAAVSTLTQG